jgi:hypothetical protein
MQLACPGAICACHAPRTTPTTGLLFVTRRDQTFKELNAAALSFWNDQKADDTLARTPGTTIRHTVYPRLCVVS